MKDNKLIAEFMGMDSFKDSLASLHQGKINVDVDVYEQAQYHTSWDWLMPVVEGIFERLDSRDNSTTEIKKYMLLCCLDETYKAVVEFINQLNK